MKYPSYVITLSTIPPRFPHVHKTLKCLLRQSVPAARIILYTPRSYDRFPDWDGTPPDLPDGVELRIVDRDQGPATKILPALKEFAGTGTEILFCDDDMAYGRHWARAILRQRLRKPDACITLFGRDLENPSPQEREGAPMPRAVRSWKITDVEYHLRMAWHDFTRKRLGWKPRYVGRRATLFAGYRDTLYGFGGVLVRPEFFPDEVYDIPVELWGHDDFWLAGMAALKGHVPWVVPRVRLPMSFDYYLVDDLTHNVVKGASREDLNALAPDFLRRKYGIWK